MNFNAIFVFLALLITAIGVNGERENEKFPYHDGDGDGRITVAEVKAALQNLGIRYSDFDAEAALLMTKADTNGDGAITAGSEFEAYIATLGKDLNAYLIDNLRLDGSKYVSFEEIVAAVGVFQQYPPGN